MAIQWITPEGLIIDNYENNYVEVIIKLTNENELELTKISGTLPDGLFIESLGNNEFLLKGTLPNITEETKYYFTLNAYDNITNENSQQYFLIINKLQPTTWKEQQDTFQYYEFEYVNIKLLLENPQGNESFEKISGSLPSSLLLSKDGLIYGTLDEIINESTYTFMVGIKRNNEIILSKQFNIIVKKINSSNTPIWISDEGNIGTINYNEESTLFISAIDSQNRPLTYTLLDDNLPQGLSLNSSSGKIEGICLTKYNIDWEFSVSVTNGIETIQRKFIISTNVLNNNDKIEWITDNYLGEIAIGEYFQKQLEITSTKKTIFRLIGGTMPKGLTLLSSGLIQGKIIYQDTQDYTFLIEANNGVSFSQKYFNINVKQGILNKNSVNAYFYINNEHLYEYNDLKSNFNINNAYNYSYEKYRVPLKPRVDLCVCKTFDKILLRYLLSNINTPITFNWKYTKKEDFYVNDNIEYSVYYKSLLEEPYNSYTHNYFYQPYNKKYIDKDVSYVYAGTNINVIPTSEIIEDYVYNETTNQYDKVNYFIDENNEKIYVDIIIIYYEEGTHNKITPTSNVWFETSGGEPYIINNDKQILIGYAGKNNFYIENTNEVISLNEKIYTRADIINNKLIIYNYIIKNNEEIIVNPILNDIIYDKETNIIIGNLEDYTIYKKDITKRYYYYIGETYNVFTSSIDYIRNQLNKKFIVEKLNKKNVYYKTGTQELVDEEYTKKEYIVKWSEEKQSYYIELIDGFVFFGIYVRNPYNEVEEYVPVYALINNTKNYYCGNAIVNIDEMTHNGGSASTTQQDFNYFINGNDSSYEIKELTIKPDNESELVDYHYYMVYKKGTLDVLKNKLFSLEWKPDIKFICNDDDFYMVSKIDNPYIYKAENNSEFGFNKTIVLPYITDDDVNEDMTVQFFDKNNEILPEWKKTYYPTLDLFYSKPNTNVTVLSKINNKEDKGEYWNGRKFIFYELHFESTDGSFDTFSINFYHHTNLNSPEFQLI